MPEVLQNNPLIIAVIVLVLVLLIAIPVLIRRRRSATEDVVPPPELGQSVDYTSLPYEEPTGVADRFRRLSIGAKLLIFLVPLVTIIAVVILVMTLQSSPTADKLTPVAPLSTITNVLASVVGESKILVTADTNLPNGASVTAALKENGQDFAWFNPQTATVQASDGKIKVTLEKLKNAPVPREGQEYTVVLSATSNDQAITSEPAKVEVGPVLKAKFFQIAAVVPTSEPTAAPTTAPTGAPTSEPTTTPPPAPTEPTATTVVSLTATAFNGGNIRQQPKIQACTCPQLHAGEVVTLLEKTVDSRWYRVIAPEGTGWVSSTLLRIDANIAKQVPVVGQGTPPTPAPGPSDLTATVANGGHVRQTPVTGLPLDEVNAGETVQLLSKTADGAWYKITDIRGKTGWVSVTLLKIDPDVAKRVPIAK